MRVRCSRPEMLPDLRDFLARGAWTSEKVAPDELELHPPLGVGSTARSDLRFSLLSWLAEHPSAAVEIDGPARRVA
jgi:hypothetical protein